MRLAALVLLSGCIDYSLFSRDYGKDDMATPPAGDMAMDRLPACMTTWCRSVSGSVQQLTSVWGSSANRVWVVGHNGTLLYFNGPLSSATKWESHNNGASDYKTVHGTASDDVWTISAYGRALNWNGNLWIMRQTVPSQEFQHGIFALRKDLAFTAGDLPGAGGGGISYQWDGNSWVLSKPNGGGGLEAVWAASETQGWLVGGSVYSRSGQSWVLATGLPTADRIYAVFGRNISDVYFGGNSFVHHHDGTQFDDTMTVAGSIRGIWAGEKGVWAVGGYMGAGVILRKSGTSWMPENLPDTPVPLQLYGIWGDDATTLWAVGDNGEILYRNL